MSTQTGEIGLGPSPYSEEYLRSAAWIGFHEDVLDKGPALDYLIDFFEFINEKDSEDYGHEFYSKGYDKEIITKLDLHHHFYNLLRKDAGEFAKCKDPELCNKYIWNTQNNILRVLKRMKHSEPLYLLPREDRALTYNFINRLNHPPRDTDY